MEISGFSGAPSADQMAARREQMLANLDTDKNGGLSVEETSQSKNGDKLAELIGKADTDGDGLMTAREANAYLGAASTSGRPEGGRPEGAGRGRSQGAGGASGANGPPPWAATPQNSEADMQTLILSMLEDSDSTDEASSSSTMATSTASTTSGSSASAMIADVIAKYELSLKVLEDS